MFPQKKTLVEQTDADEQFEQPTDTKYAVEGAEKSETVDEMIERVLRKQEPLMEARMNSFIESLGAINFKKFGAASSDE